MIKIGFVDTIFADSTFEEVMDKAAELNYECVEVAAWPKLSDEEVAAVKAAYPTTPPSLLNYFVGITHIDIAELDDAKIAYIKDYEKKTGVKISALSYYGNPLEPNDNLRKVYFQHLQDLVVAASKLDIGIINAFIGRDSKKGVEENLKDAIELWTPVIRNAEKYKIKIAIENCPMYFTAEQWPGGTNCMTTPAIWKRMFDAIPSDYFGLAYDPSHMGWQHMDYIKPIYDFKDKIFFVHFKDAKIYKEKLDQVGIMAHPLEFYAPKLPGFGDVNWGAFISALNEIGFRGYASIEIEDEAFTDSKENIDKALALSLKTMRQYIV